MELTREHYWAMVFCDFTVGLNQKECLQLLLSAYGNEVPACATLFRSFTEFRRGQTSLLDEEHTESLLSAVVPESVPASAV